MSNSKYIFAAAIALVLAAGLLTGCGGNGSNRIPGYVEGDFVYISSPLGGKLEALYVKRGDQVAAGDSLFSLESVPERAAFIEAKRRLGQARARLNDLKKGLRPSEIESLQAQLKQAQAALTLSEKEQARQEKLFESALISQQDLDRINSQKTQDQSRVAQLEAEIKTAQLGSRSDQIAAAQDEVSAMEAAREKAEWDLSQKRQTAPRAGQITDLIYREGEWVAAGRPIVVLLPPGNIKVRSFIPEAEIGRIHLGDSLQVSADGWKSQITGGVSFISPQAEYTPPVIYSQDSRKKLVFMIEVRFDSTHSKDMHPGQPVDLKIGL